MEHVSNKDDVKTSLRKVVREVRSGFSTLTSEWGGCIGDVGALSLAVLRAGLDGALNTLL